ncbi:translation initiation factor IF-2-like [Mustela erminea]|uniref:translation initiation factor IF-2-like n=1 Tax=Mustela erminea TaxID=36723 RepID=UPI0013872D0F|nr:translation initiation factor IF-2-like [Mustela erminea]
MGDRKEQKEVPRGHTQYPVCGGDPQTSPQLNAASSGRADPQLPAPGPPGPSPPTVARTDPPGPPAKRLLCRPRPPRLWVSSRLSPDADGPSSGVGREPRCGRPSGRVRSARGPRGALGYRVARSRGAAAGPGGASRRPRAAAPRSPRPRTRGGSARSRGPARTAPRAEAAPGMSDASAPGEERRPQVPTEGTGTRPAYAPSRGHGPGPDASGCDLEPDRTRGRGPGPRLPQGATPDCDPDWPPR